jgi:hypothetical protein
MKMRIKGNSLRLRVSRSEAARLIQTGRLEEAIGFSPEDSAKLTYALELSAAAMEMNSRFRPQEITVTLPTLEARQWFKSDQVGLFSEAEVGNETSVLAVEKDFACLDDSEADSEDAYCELLSLQERSN